MKNADELTMRTLCGDDVFTMAKIISMTDISKLENAVSGTGGAPAALTEGCADPYGPKTVRATMGAIFRTPPSRLTREALIEQCRLNQIPLIVTALSEDASDIRQADLKHAAVVIGSEGRGVSETLLSASDQQIVIPMHPRCESLNAAAAAAIVLWQMTQL